MPSARNIVCDLTTISGIAKYSKFPKLWMMKGQILSQMGEHSTARKWYAKGNVLINYEDRKCDYFANFAKLTMVSDERCLRYFVCANMRSFQAK